MPPADVTKHSRRRPYLVHRTRRCASVHRFEPAERSKDVSDLSSEDPTEGIPMVLLLALPVFATVALVHRYLQRYAPSNVLARRVRTTTPRLRTVPALIVLASVLLAGMHVLAEAIVAGAPSGLNLVVLVLAWDAIKVSWLAVGVVVRLVALAARGLMGGAARPRATGPYS